MQQCQDQRVNDARPARVDLPPACIWGQAKSKLEPLVAGCRPPFAMRYWTRRMSSGPALPASAATAHALPRLVLDQYREMCTYLADIVAGEWPVWTLTGLAHPNHQLPGSVGGKLLINLFQWVIQGTRACNPRAARECCTVHAACTAKSRPRDNVDGEKIPSMNISSSFISHFSSFTHVVHGARIHSSGRTLVRCGVAGPCSRPLWAGEA